MRVLVSALLFCVPVALFAMDMEKANVKADQNVTNVVMNDDLNQANNDQINLDEGATDEWRGGGRGWGGRGWGGRGWGGRGWGGWGYGGWGYGLGYGYAGWAYPWYSYYPAFYGWGW